VSLQLALEFKVIKLVTIIGRLYSFKKGAHFVKIYLLLSICDLVSAAKPLTKFCLKFEAGELTNIFDNSKFQPL
jgi:hypothetical protein